MLRHVSIKIQIFSDEAPIIFKSIVYENPEIIKSGRAIINFQLDEKENTVLVNIEAKDPTAARAAVNAVLRAIQSLELCYKEIYIRESAEK